MVLTRMPLSGYDRTEGKILPQFFIICKFCEVVLECNSITGQTKVTYELCYWLEQITCLLLGCLLEKEGWLVLTLV